jgi:putative lipase involved disintegration of autophagic bodies
VHSGFYSAYLSVATKVTDKVEALLKVYANATFTITGHSLGGALAEITGTVLIT